LRICAASAAESPAVATNRSDLSTVTHTRGALKSSQERTIEARRLPGPRGATFSKSVASCPQRHVELCIVELKFPDCTDERAHRPIDDVDRCAAC
jgi:hypothetical protein